MKKILVSIIVIITIIILWIIFSNTSLSTSYNNWLQNKAIHTKDTSYCSKMTSMGYTPGPKSNCYAQVALYNEDITICDSIDLNDIPGRDSCYIDFVLQKEDASYCYKSSVDAIRNECLNLFNICSKTSDWCGRKLKTISN